MWNWIGPRRLMQASTHDTPPKPMSSKLPTSITDVSMNRQTADRLIAALVIGILLVGGYATVRAYWRLRTTSGMMQMMPGMDPILYAFGTLIAVSAMLGTYAVARDTFTTNPTAEEETELSQEMEIGTEQDQDETNFTPDLVDQNPSPKVHSVLPEDEQQVIEPVLESPGLTQVELRGRSDFSKAKVSQTVTELEDRGLLYREKQGRTYRVYPGELVKNKDQNNGSVRSRDSHD